MTKVLKEFFYDFKRFGIIASSASPFLFHIPPAIVLNHRHNDFFLQGVAITEQQKDAGIADERISMRVGDTDIADALMGFRLLSHKLLTSNK